MFYRVEKFLETCFWYFYESYIIFFYITSKTPQRNEVLVSRTIEPKTHHILRNEITFDGKGKEKQSHSGTVAYMNWGTIESSGWILWRLNFFSDLFSVTNCWKRSPGRFLNFCWETRKGLLSQYLMIVEFPFNQKFKQNRNVKSRSSHR